MTAIEYWTQICVDLVKFDGLSFKTAINLVNSLKDFEKSQVKIKDLAERVVKELKVYH